MKLKDTSKIRPKDPNRIKVKRKNIQMKSKLVKRSLHDMQSNWIKFDPKPSTEAKPIVKKLETIETPRGVVTVSQIQTRPVSPVQKKTAGGTDYQTSFLSFLQNVNNEVDVIDEGSEDDQIDIKYNILEPKQEKLQTKCKKVEPKRNNKLQSQPKRTYKIQRKKSKDGISELPKKKQDVVVKQELIEKETLVSSNDKNLLPKDELQMLIKEELIKNETSTISKDTDKTESMSKKNEEHDSIILTIDEVIKRSLEDNSRSLMFDKSIKSSMKGCKNGLDIASHIPSNNFGSPTVTATKNYIKKRLQSSSNKKCSQNNSRNKDVQPKPTTKNKKVTASSALVNGNKPTLTSNQNIMYGAKSNLTNGQSQFQPVKSSATVNKSAVNLNMFPDIPKIPSQLSVYKINPENKSPRKIEILNTKPDVDEIDTLQDKVQQGSATLQNLLNISNNVKSNTNEVKKKMRKNSNPKNVKDLLKLSVRDGSPSYQQSPKHGALKDTLTLSINGESFPYQSPKRSPPVENFSCFETSEGSITLYGEKQEEESMPNLQRQVEVSDDGDNMQMPLLQPQCIPTSSAQEQDPRDAETVQYTYLQTVPVQEIEEDAPILYSIQAQNVAVVPSENVAVVPSVYEVPSIEYEVQEPTTVFSIQGVYQTVQNSFTQTNNTPIRQDESQPVILEKKPRKPNNIWANQNYYTVNRCSVEKEQEDRFYPMSNTPIVLKDHGKNPNDVNLDLEIASEEIVQDNNVPKYPEETNKSNSTYIENENTGENATSNSFRDQDSKITDNVKETGKSRSNKKNNEHDFQELGKINAAKNNDNTKDTNEISSNEENEKFLENGDISNNNNINDNNKNNIKNGNCVVEKNSNSTGDKSADSKQKALVEILKRYYSTSATEEEKRALSEKNISKLILNIPKIYENIVKRLTNEVKLQQKRSKDKIPYETENKVIISSPKVIVENNYFDFGHDLSSFDKQKYTQANAVNDNFEQSNVNEKENCNSNDSNQENIFNNYSSNQKSVIEILRRYSKVNTSMDDNKKKNLQKLIENMEKQPERYQKFTEKFTNELKLRQIRNETSKDDSVLSDQKQEISIVNQGETPSPFISISEAVKLRNARDAAKSLASKVPSEEERFNIFQAQVMKSLEFKEPYREVIDVADIQTSNELPYSEIDSSNCPSEINVLPKKSPFKKRGPEYSRAKIIEHAKKIKKMREKMKDMLNNKQVKSWVENSLSPNLKKQMQLLTPLRAKVVLEDVRSSSPDISLMNEGDLIEMKNEQLPYAENKPTSYFYLTSDDDDDDDDDDDSQDEATESDHSYTVKKSKKRIPHPLQAHEEVWARHKNGRFYRGKIINIQNLTYCTALFTSDGSLSQNLLASDIVEWKNKSLKVGEPVKVKWADGKIYDAKFLGAKTKCYYTVLFEDESQLELQRNVIYSITEMLPKKVINKLSYASEMQNREHLYDLERELPPKRPPKPKEECLNRVFSP
ncbi:hypothetical protein ILUMI_24706 [Ignelater luminosus]|uniref:Tudor domain-containing protein n=1 Tax=Ignelater luminosus TaxID=2038154 RepID=A0A8K0CCZ8_IGNLU|nr:hypothetical protein ILUMI_24706 [Ignelater luminosus]